MQHAQDSYYVPHETKWPIIGSIALFLLTSGFASRLNGIALGEAFMIIGTLLLIYMLWGWWGEAIGDGVKGLLNDQVERSYRWGMGWFIASEVFFFGAFFGALYYTRVFAIPWLGGDGTAGEMTNALLWPDYDAAWPSNGPEAVGGVFTPMAAWGIPALNTLILLTSGLTCTLAHWAILKDRVRAFCFWVAVTVVLGLIFIGFQAYEYAHAYADLNLKLTTGAYGSTFFMLTGFHGAHVTIGAIMLLVMLFRGMRGHFNSKEHFGFEAAAWYWHFVDVVWLGLFIFVYWL